MSRPIAVIGTGGLGREIHQLICDLVASGAPWTFVGFLDDDPATHGSTVHGHPVLGGSDWLIEHDQTAAVIGIGTPRVRRTLDQRLSGQGFDAWATLIHPLSTVGQNVQMGPGSMICAGSHITCDIRMGRHALINLNCTVGHDAVFEDWVTLAPGANISGNVHLEHSVDFGTNASIIQGVRVGAETIVGAGAVVVRDLPSGVTAVGAPARPLRKRPTQ